MPTITKPPYQGSMDVCIGALKKLKIWDHAPSPAQTFVPLPPNKLSLSTQDATVDIENGEAHYLNFKPKIASKVMDVQAKKC